MGNQSKFKVGCERIGRIFLFFICVNTYSQTSMVGPLNPDTASNNNGLGTLPWEDQFSTSTSNNSYASVTTLIFGAKTNYLLVSDFGFTIPAAATVNGIEVEMEKGASGLFQNVTDNSVKIVRAGGVVGIEHAQSSKWPGIDAYFVYGNSSDNWGVGWSPADINSSGFGVAISADLSGSVVFPSARIDHVRIKVFYTLPLPVEVLRFDATRTDRTNVEVLWTTISETNNDFFTLERSTDAENWQDVKEIDGAGDHIGNLNYFVSDMNSYILTSYYRLKQTDFNGNYKYYYSIIEVPPSEKSEPIFFPNPSEDVFSVIVTEDQSHLEIINSKGIVVISKLVNAGKSDIDISILPNDIYLVRIRSSRQLFTSKMMKQK